MRLGSANCGQAIAASSQRAADRIKTLEQLASSARNSRTWTSRSCSTRPATCSRSATTSATSVSTTASTICWRPRLAWRAIVTIAQGQVGQEHWFALGRMLTSTGGATDAVELERLDVRVPDAAPGHAHLREHTARPDLPGVGAPADRLRQAARRAVGHLGVGVQHDRRPHELSVPRVRRSGAGIEARAGRGSGHRTVCQRPGPDGGAGGGVREPGTPGRGRPRRRLRPVRSHRLHAVAGAPAERPASPSASSWPTTRG